MRVKYLGESEPLSLLKGKIYDVEAIDEDGLYEIRDESGEVYCYFPEAFEIVEETVTEAEKKLIKLLIKIDNDKDSVICASLLARETKMTEECISFIEENPDADSNDVLNFLVHGEDDLL